MHIPSRRTMLAAAMLLPLAACTETASEVRGRTRPDRKVVGLTISLASLSGAPEATISLVSTALVTEAQKRDILIVGVDTKPRYQARGYLSLSAGEGGKPELSYAFDMYDQARQRAKRVSGVLPAGADWSSVTPAIAARLAASTLDDFAEYVLETTTLVAGASGPSSPARSGIAIQSNR